MKHFATYGWWAELVYPRWSILMAWGLVLFMGGVQTLLARPEAAAVQQALMVIEQTAQNVQHQETLSALRLQRTEEQVKEMLVLLPRIQEQQAIVMQSLFEADHKLVALMQQDQTYALYVLKQEVDRVKQKVE